MLGKSYRNVKCGIILQVWDKVFELFGKRNENRNNMVPTESDNENV